ncbi:unnamed protein product [Ceutorhynchus assimilis]|uniref:Mutator-like transposase domain-containing protein n=1 Tax=Ceutorhynchus assimilis TaxID=467358 RepID=A0A9N9MXX7_9CUCU|nr:unnamed protein product [Ceutorhynchus assimilis]
MSISPDEQLHEFSFISQEEYNEVNEHIIEVERTPRPDSTVIQGNKIVDLEYATEICMELQFKHSQRCTLGLLKVHREICNGLVSTIVFCCNMCNFQTKCRTQKGTEEIGLQLNYACVWATFSGGTTFKTMTEFLSIMNIPSLSYRMYHKLELKLANDWKKPLWGSMEEAGIAGKEEYDNAVATNALDVDGVPWITVYLDGGWSHRSYGHNYNAASGVAVIIGKHTGKILFLGVRNKYCCVCAKAEKKGEEPHEHLCFKNWNGSSGAMEADIISEGFRESIKMHGLKYWHFIADGDSSVHAKIQQTVPYGNEVRKIACKNHIIKNYGTALYKLKNDTTIAAAGRKYLTVNAIKDLENIGTKAIYINAHGDVDNLKTDLENGPYHVFGNHLTCNPLYCQCIGDFSNKVAEMEIAGIFNRITTVLQRIVVSQGHKLIDNETNNRAEMFMSLLCKFNAGKRLNTIQKGSLQTRAYLSGLRYNKGADWQSSTWLDSRPTVPGTAFQSFVRKCKKRREYDSCT